MARTEAFDKYLAEYEQWFIDNRYVFLSELEAVRVLLPDSGRGVEIGVGSGIFASSLNIEEGCDPSVAMRKKSQSRGIRVIDCIAEYLPWDDNTFDYVLMVTTICFVDDPQKAIREINRVLKPGGVLVIGFVDMNSPVGKDYIKHRDKSHFYSDASFFSTDEIHKLLRENNLITHKTIQTVFDKPDKITDIQPAKNGYGEGSFIVIKAFKGAI
ncbi:MAG TPA: SAM-dependent methyltransferase [Bacteroidales bacterium]|nr:SAM-dependent methyltransferase [Bacteroidales bacterium]